MRAKITYRRAWDKNGQRADVPTYWIDGKEVSERDYRRLVKDKPIGIPGYETEWRKPVKSDGAAVHPDDAEAASVHAARNGVPTQFLADGRPVFQSARHQSAYLRLIGMHNNDGVRAH